MKERYKNKDDLFRLLFFLFTYNRNGDLFHYVLNLLKLSNDQVIKMLDHKVKPTQQDTSPGAIKYHRVRIIQEVVKYNSLDGLKRLIAIITEKVFLQQVFINDDYNSNVLEKGTLYVFY